jgi:hypothetical protein
MSGERYLLFLQIGHTSSALSFGRDAPPCFLIPLEECDFGVGFAVVFNLTLIVVLFWSDDRSACICDFML